MKLILTLKPFRYFLLLLLFAFNPAYESNSFGDLNWDYQCYLTAGKANRGMAHVQDLNERIETSLKEGNISRADHLANLSKELIATGGPFGLSKKKASPEEEKIFTRSAALIGKTTMESYKKNKRDEYGMIDKEWISHANSLFHFNPVKAGYCAQQASIFQLLILSSLEWWNEQQKISSSSPAPVTDNIANKIEDFIENFNEILKTQGRWSQGTSETRGQPYFEDIEPVPIHYETLKTHLNEAYFLKMLSGAHEEVKRVYALPVPDIKKPYYTVRNDRTIELHDQKMDLKFTLYDTPADNHCFYHAISQRFDYYYNINSCFHDDLLELSGENRVKAFLFMKGHFIDKIKKNPEVVKDSKWRNAIVLETKELKSTGNNHVSFKRTPNGYARSSTDTGYEVSKNLLNLIKDEQSPIWKDLLADDFENKTGREIWGTGLDPDITNHYSALYAYLNNLMVVTYTGNQQKGFTWFYKSPYVPPKPEKIVFILGHNGKHFSSLRPVNKNLPAWVHKSSEGSTLTKYADESYLKKWHML